MWGVPVTAPDMLRLAVAVGAENAYAGVAYVGHDGDTHHIIAPDVLTSTPVVLMVRIAGINANELHEPGGPEAAAALATLLSPGTVVTMRRLRPDKFAGRVVAQVTTADGVDVAAWLVDHGLAVPWSGVGVKPHVPWPPA
jgi:endonuclease YncB( thermonuclease family)